MVITVNSEAQYNTAKHETIDKRPITEANKNCFVCPVNVTEIINAAKSKLLPSLPSLPMLLKSLEMVVMPSGINCFQGVSL